MLKGIKKHGLVLAGAATLLASGFMASVFADDVASDGVKCVGTSPCTGKTDCQQDQDGKWTWKATSAEECTTQGGTVDEMKTEKQ